MQYTYENFDESLKQLNIHPEDENANIKCVLRCDNNPRKYKGLNFIGYKLNSLPMVYVGFYKSSIIDKCSFKTKNSYSFVGKFNNMLKNNEIIVDYFSCIIENELNDVILCSIDYTIDKEILPLLQNKETSKSEKVEIINNKISSVIKTVEDYDAPLNVKFYAGNISHATELIKIIQCIPLYEGDAISRKGIGKIDLVDFLKAYAKYAISQLQ